MAAQRVQNYLKKHKIGPLFESLMARVIQDTPDDPVGYIIEILHEIHDKQSKKIDNNFNNVSSRSPSRHLGKKGTGRRPNHLAASWSAGTTQQERRKQLNGNQMRTWSANNYTDQPAWNSDTRVPTHDFDELFQMQHGSDQSASQKQPSEKYDGVRSWEAQEKLQSVEQKFSFQSTDNDELGRELRLGKSSSATEDPDTHRCSRIRPIKACRQAAEKHRQHLQAILLEDSNQEKLRTGGIRHSPEDRGTELYERMEDLQQEGVIATSHSLTGVTPNKSRHQAVSVTICARCARIIGKDDNDDLLSQASSDFNGTLFDDITKKQDRSSIDSASEAREKLSSKERNVWPMTDSEYESSPHNTARSFKSFDNFPQKESKHMYKTSDKMDDSQQLTHRSSASRNSHFDFPLDFSNTSRNAWQIQDDLSDDSDYAEMTQRQPRSQASGSMNERAWRPRSSGENMSDDDSTVTQD